MEDDELSRAETVSALAAGAVFANPRSRRTLMLFAAEPLSVGEAATRAGADLKRLHHHVTRLCRLGLLRVVGKRTRAGRPIKLYRTSSAAYFVPAELLPKQFGDDLADELRTYLAQDSRRTVAGMLVSTGPEGQLRARIVADEAVEPRSLEMWRILRLDRAEAKALGRDLRAVLDRYERTTGARGEVHLVHVAMARRMSEGGPVDNPHG